MVSLIQDFEGVESQPQNPEFRYNSANFHPCEWSKEQTPSKCDCISPKVKQMVIVNPGKIYIAVIRDKSSSCCAVFMLYHL